MSATHATQIARFAQFAQIAPMPWKNGRGTTTQLAIHPPGATTAAFDWRVSIARLDASAPFSEFVGVDRYLAVLQGEMTLLREGSDSATLTPASLPMRFAGSEKMQGQVVRGPVLDLNVMFKVPGWRAVMRRIRVSTDTTLSLNGSALLCSLSRAIDLQMQGLGMKLALFDLLELRTAGELRLFASASRPVDAYLIEFQRQQSPGEAPGG